MEAVAVIPARMGSTRFPGKPLAKICGLTMLEHIYRRVSMAKGLSAVHIATCDDEIREAVEVFGGTAIMTADTHQRASDRTAEAAGELDADVVVMVQGDEPMVRPEMIDLSLKPLQDDARIVCSNLMSKIHSRQEFTDINTVKVVTDKDGFALYFSREPIPTVQGVKGFDSDVPLHKQVCIIPFRREFLLRYVRLTPTPLEIAESIDMLRCLEHGYKIRMVECETKTHAVDSPEDLLLVEQMMENDDLIPLY